MIILAMLRARWIQALTMFAFSAGATVATIAGPAYLQHVHQRIVAHDFDTAPLPQRLLTLDGGEGDNQSGPDALDVMKVLLPTTGFTWISAREFTGIDTARDVTDRAVDRQDICAHVTIVSGRCLVGIGEILVPQSLAAKLDARVGATIPLTYKVVDQFDSFGDPVEDYGTPSVFSITVVGIYRPTDMLEPYWGSGNYFPVGGERPLLTNDSTLAAMNPVAVGASIDALAGRSAFADTTRLAGQLDKLTTQLSTLNGSVTVHSGIPDTIAEIRADRSNADQVVPIAAVPAVVLAWFVVFVASAYGAAGRRQEFANIALRGSPLGTRWRLALGEGVLAVVAGTLVAWIGTAIWTPVPYGWPLLALAGCLLAVAAAAVGPLGTSVAVLLRSASGSGAANRFRVTGEVLVVVLAAAAYVLMRSQHGRLTGFSLMVPWLVILGVSVVASILVTPVARRIGALAMTRGRVATALAAYQVGRRPGARRLLILLTIAVAVLAYSLAGLAVATQDRRNISTVTTGATTVLDVTTATRDRLLDGVRAADPRGRWAMAVVSTPETPDDTNPTLAVDATRFASVVAWMPGYSAVSAARIGAQLHPGGSAAVPTFRGSTLTVSGSVGTGSDSLLFGVVVVPLDGSAPATATADLRAGPLVVTFPVPCTAGCEFRQFVVSSRNASPYSVAVTVTSVRAGSTGAVDLSSAAGWRVQSGTVSASGAGIVARVRGVSGRGNSVWLRPDDVPVPLPAVSTENLGDDATVLGLDGQPLRVTGVETASALPRLGRAGTMIDLEYADRSTVDGNLAVRPQVWLGPHAPANAVALLASHGILVIDATTLAGTRDALDRQGAVLALWYHVFAALLALVLTVGTMILVAATDRPGRGAELRALRVQGISVRTMARAARGGYAVITLIAAGLGLLAGALAWKLTASTLPIYTATDVWPAPHWPAARSVIVPWCVVVALLLLIALGIGANLRRAVTRPPR